MPMNGFSDQNQRVVVILNETPQPRPGYEIAVRLAGRYHLVINCDDSIYGGSGYLEAPGDKQPGGETAAEQPVYETGLSGEVPVLTIDLPPLSALILEHAAKEP